MSRARRIAKLGVLAGGTLSADRLEINRRKDGVLGLDTPGGSFLEQRYRGLTAARAMKDVNIQVRHDSSPVVEESICLARKEACDGNRHSARLESRHGRISLPVSVTAPQSTAIRTAKLVAPITHAIHAPTWTGRAFTSFQNFRNFSTSTCILHARISNSQGGQYCTFVRPGKGDCHQFTKQ